MELQLVFERFKNIHYKESCFLLGTGPTLSQFNCYMEERLDFEVKVNAKIIGCNELVYAPYIIDYYFIGDKGNRKRGYLSDKKTYENFRPGEFQFIRRRDNNRSGFELNEGANYFVSGRRRINSVIDFSNNLIINPMGSYGSISFEMLQFAVWCGFKNIYLIGLDLNYKQGSYYCESARNYIIKPLIDTWKIAKEWLETKEGINVYSVNPVGLKGIFPEKKLSDIFS